MNGQILNVRGDRQVGTFSQSPIDEITIEDSESASFSELVLASGTLDNGVLMKSDFEDSGLFRV